MINCPKCNSTRVKSYDNSSLYHPTKSELINDDYQYDTEVYINFECIDCGDTFTKVFDLKPQQE